MRRIEQPCQRCYARQKDCVYATKEAIIPVPESYLQRIDRTLNELKDTLQSNVLRSGPVTPTVLLPAQAVSNDRQGQEACPAAGAEQDTLSRDQTGADSLVDDSTAESFIRKLKEVMQTGTPGRNVWWEQSPAAMSTSQRSSGSASSQQGHATMRFDTLRMQHFDLFSMLGGRA